MPSLAAALRQAWGSGSLLIALSGIGGAYLALLFSGYGTWLATGKTWREAVGLGGAFPLILPDSGSPWPLQMALLLPLLALLHLATGYALSRHFAAKLSGAPPGAWHRTFPLAFPGMLSMLGALGLQVFILGLLSFLIALLLLPGLIPVVGKWLIWPLLLAALPLALLLLGVLIWLGTGLFLIPVIVGMGGEDALGGAYHSLAALVRIPLATLGQIIKSLLVFGGLLSATVLTGLGVGRGLWYLWQHLYPGFGPLLKQVLFGMVPQLNLILGGLGATPEALPATAVFLFLMMLIALGAVLIAALVSMNWHLWCVATLRLYRKMTGESLIGNRPDDH